jgi:hypothetical protein
MGGEVISANEDEDWMRTTVVKMEEMCGSSKPKGKASCRVRWDGMLKSRSK